MMKQETYAQLRDRYNAKRQEVETLNATRMARPTKENLARLDGALAQLQRIWRRFEKVEKEYSRRGKP